MSINSQNYLRLLFTHNLLANVNSSIICTFRLQAAVSSASSSNSDENVNANQIENSSSANENFFSLTEDDTPQNSPMKTIPLNSSASSTSGKAVSVDLHSPSTQNMSSSSLSFSSLNNGNPQRTRKLSNSSMASDVSFRLPHYDSQPVSSNPEVFSLISCYHLILLLDLSLTI